MHVHCRLSLQHNSWSPMQPSNSRLLPSTSKQRLQSPHLPRSKQPASTSVEFEHLPGMVFQTLQEFTKIVRWSPSTQTPLPGYNHVFGGMASRFSKSSPVHYSAFLVGFQGSISAATDQVGA